MPPEERLQVAFAISAPGPSERLYFAVWGVEGEVLASNMDPWPRPRATTIAPRMPRRQDAADDEPRFAGDDHAGFRWQTPDRRELSQVGPHGEQAAWTDCKQCHAKAK